MQCKAVRRKNSGYASPRSHQSARRAERARPAAFQGRPGGPRAALSSATRARRFRETGEKVHYASRQVEILASSQSEAKPRACHLIRSCVSGRQFALPRHLSQQREQRRRRANEIARVSAAAKLDGLERLGRDDDVEQRVRVPAADDEAQTRRQHGHDRRRGVHERRGRARRGRLLPRGRRLAPDDTQERPRARRHGSVRLRQRRGLQEGRRRRARRAHQSFRRRRRRLRPREAVAARDFQLQRGRPTGRHGAEASLVRRLGQVPRQRQAVGAEQQDRAGAGTRVSRPRWRGRPVRREFGLEGRGRRRERRARAGVALGGAAGTRAQRDRRPAADRPAAGRAAPRPRGAQTEGRGGGQTVEDQAGRRGRAGGAHREPVSGGAQHGARGESVPGDGRAPAGGEPHEGRSARGRGGGPQDPGADLDTGAAEPAPAPADLQLVVGPGRGRRPAAGHRRHLRQAPPALAVALQSQVRPRELAAGLAASRAGSLAAVRRRQGRLREGSGPRVRAPPGAREEAREGARPAEPRAGLGGGSARARPVPQVEGQPLRRQGRAVRRAHFPRGHRPLPRLPQRRARRQGATGRARRHYLRRGRQRQGQAGLPQKVRPAGGATTMPLSDADKRSGEPVALHIADLQEPNHSRVRLPELSALHRAWPRQKLRARRLLGNHATTQGNGTGAPGPSTVLVRAVESLPKSERTTKSAASTLSLFCRNAVHNLSFSTSDATRRSLRRCFINNKYEYGIRVI